MEMLQATPEFQEDMAARKLLRGLSVRTEPRVYLIVLRYTAGDPERAALIANAFVVEFLQTITLQTLYHQREAAERTLLEKRATFGEKHPKVTEAQMRLRAADALLNAQMGKTTEEIERTGDGNVTFAQADMVPSSPKSANPDWPSAAYRPRWRHCHGRVSGGRAEGWVAGSKSIDEDIEGFRQQKNCRLRLRNGDSSDLRTVTHHLSGNPFVPGGLLMLPLCP